MKRGGGLFICTLKIKGLFIVVSQLVMWVGEGGGSTPRGALGFENVPTAKQSYRARVVNKR